MTQVWLAELAWPGYGPVLAQAGFALEAGKVLAFGSEAELLSGFAAEVSHYAYLGVPPANPHTHLDLSGLATYHGDYLGFIRYVIANRASRNLNSAQIGMSELVANGTGAFGDIVTDPLVMRWLLESSPLPGIAYWEVLDPSPKTAQETFARTRRQLAEFRSWAGGRVKVGISPHAPHTVSPELMRDLALLAQDQDYPLAIHVGEFAGELEYFQTGGGPLLALVPPLDEPYRNSSPLAHLEALGVLQARPLLIHGVQFSPGELAGNRVVLCPRSNRNLAVAMPGTQLENSGLELALATDSRASAENLELTEEQDLLGALGFAPSGWFWTGGWQALGLSPEPIWPGTPASAIYRRSGKTPGPGK